MNSLPYRTSIFFFTDTITIKYDFEHLPPRRNPILLSFSVKTYATLSDWQASEVLHICGQLSPFTSSVERLGITVMSESEGLQRFSHDQTDTVRWVELLGTFKSVQVLRLRCISSDSAIGIARALEESTREMAQEVLPVLRIIQIDGFQDRAESIHGFEAFVAARELTGQPLTVCESK
jgi:hypothetical protein